MNALPSNINIAQARLPATYEQAKVALSECNRVDECQDWANKAEALASYAKMADDDTLRSMADRIQARAVRRMGELLKQFDGSTRNKGNDGTVKTSQRHVAETAGVSERQRVTAVRVANVPAEKFEAAVEAPKPATVTKLAEMGKQVRAMPDGFKQATHLIGAVRRFSEFCQSNDAKAVAEGVLPSEAAEIREHVATIDGWLDRFVTSLRSE